MATGRNKTVIAEGRFLRFVRHDSWEFVDRRNTSGIVCIVPVTMDGRIVFVEQFRPPVQGSVIELPAGLAGDEAEFSGEDLEAAAARELEEETGYRAETLKWLSRGPLTPGVSTEVVDFFLATQLRRVHSGGGVAGENITVHGIPLADAEAWLAKRLEAGTLIDPKCYMGLYFAGKC